MCKAKCPQCGFEFEVQKPPTVSNLRWTQEEETALLRLYQAERRTIPQIAEELNRTQDAVRNHLFKLQGAGRKPDTVIQQNARRSREGEQRKAPCHGCGITGEPHCGSGGNAGVPYTNGRHAANRH